MQLRQGGIQLSASDIVNFLACEHLTQLDLRQLHEPRAVAAQDEQALLLSRKGDEWERRYLETLRVAHPGLIEIPGNLEQDAAAAATLEALRSGAPIIYQATLVASGYLGRTDFLRRTTGTSRFGAFAYEVLDTKLARTAKASHVLQLSFYSWLIGETIGTTPEYMYVVLGDGREQAFHYADYSRYFARLRERALAAVQAPNTDTYPVPCDRCATCRWNDECTERRTADDHLWQVASIRRSQIDKLEAAAVSTMHALAALPDARRIEKLSSETLGKLRHQAALHVLGAQRGVPCYELLPAATERGSSRLPPPTDGDVYFDMEGDPLHDDGGLEYLFGVSWREGGELRYRAFWAHDHAAEKRALAEFVAWVEARRQQWPELHIYHYAAYENTALKRLASQHATCETQIDAWLRERRFVDLYRVVSEAMVCSTPSYSLKEIEHFYRGQRSGEVIDAGGSIVAYERWRETRDDNTLQEIERYNRDDCESTVQLHDWLKSIRPADRSWRTTGEVLPIDPAKPRKPSSDKEEEAARERATIRDTLLASLPDPSAPWSADDNLRFIAACLVDFHQREAKPSWWKVFEAANLSLQELTEDLECIAGLQRIDPPQIGKTLPTWLYSYPEQEFKARAGDDATRADTHAPVTIVELDEATRTLRLKMSKKSLTPDPQKISIGPGEPYRAARFLRDAVVRFAGSVRDGSRRYAALESILRGEPPRLRGKTPESPIVAAAAVDVRQITSAVEALDNSHLVIQGPPGAGKTWAGARVIVDLLQAGLRVGVSSNSHKAICNLLEEIESVAAARKFQFRGAKKSDDDRTETQHCGGVCIENVGDNDAALDAQYRLVAGTAYFFCRPAADLAFDYLFVDEAGQVSLGNLVAMGVAARNLVLLGDPMQLGQPIQGAHPGRSGESTLEYLLDGLATVKPERGIFLSQTYRMHPDLCGFISDAVYDGRLKAAPGREQQTLILDQRAHPKLKPLGIVFDAVEHDGCRQKSEAEADEIVALYASLLQQRWRDHEGVEHPIAHADILVVAPYNQQVNLLRERLPASARVGTVDKLQGQEAAVVIVSMTTSNGDCLPRNIEFLYSKNRINVALSRARCLAVMVASPQLLDIRCSSTAQIALVNTLCWVQEYAGRA